VLLVSLHATVNNEWADVLLRRPTAFQSMRRLRMAAKCQTEWVSALCVRQPPDCNFDRVSLGIIETPVPPAAST
jgi:hypothetical protein